MFFAIKNFKDKELNGVKPKVKIFFCCLFLRFFVILHRISNKLNFIE